MVISQGDVVVFAWLPGSRWLCHMVRMDHIYFYELEHPERGEMCLSGDVAACRVVDRFAPDEARRMGDEMAEIHYKSWRKANGNKRILLNADIWPKMSALTFRKMWKKVEKRG